MECPKCQFDNPDSVKFCGNCGNRIEKVCSKCGAANPSQFKFCGECGHDISCTAQTKSAALTTDQMLSKIQRYLPEGLMKKVLSQKDRIQGEKRQVTVMFCDMEGFTPLSERLGPEGVYTLMGRVYETLIHKVNAYQGTVNELTGDGIMALFGAPIALEDASQRAIRAALAIHKDIARLSDSLAQETGMAPIRMRIGIHSGPVVVGTVGNNLRMEFKALGDTVNLASRMQTMAEPGTTLVTEETFKLTEGFFRFENLGEHAVKGKSAPVKFYQVLAPTNRLRRFDVNAERGLTPLTGRNGELQFLLDCYRRTKGGRGQVVSIIAEAGVGKSRLLYEFRKTVANENVSFMEGKCLSYSRGAAYHPIIDILKESFDVRENDSDSQIRRKVKKSLKFMKALDVSILPYLLLLLSAKDTGLNFFEMSTEELKNRMIEAIKGIVIRGSETNPLIIVIEDLHWIDKSSEDLLKAFQECMPGIPVLLIVTYRPEYDPMWVSKSFHNQITLNPLTNEESLAIACYLLSAGNLDRNLSALILEKTEGVPFFIEEFIRSLEDLNYIERSEDSCKLIHDVSDLVIPSTIHDIIMTRVDALTESGKSVLQTGSVIDREFSYQLIKQIMLLPEPELNFLLSTLKDSELLYERGLSPESTFFFKHNFIREVVYESILEKNKRKLHEVIGNAIENVCKDKIEEHFETLSAHFLAAANYAKGAEYSRLASLKSEKTGALRDCIDHMKKRVEALERLSPKNNPELRDAIMEARVQLALYMFQMGYFRAAKETVCAVQDSVLKCGPSRNAAMIYIFIGSYEYMVKENFHGSVKYLEEALGIAEQVRDIVSFGFASFMLSMVLFFNCEFNRASSYLQSLLEISLAVRNNWRASAMQSNLSVYAYAFKGQVGQGYLMSRDALHMAEESGDILSMAMAYTNHGIACYCKGFLEKAKNYLLKGVVFAEKIELMTHCALAHQWLGHTYFDLGDNTSAVNHYREAIQLREQSGLFPSSANMNKIALARAKMLDGQKTLDLEQLVMLAGLNKVKLCEGWVARFMGQLFMCMGRKYHTIAMEWIMKAIESHSRNNMKCDLGRDYAILSELLRAGGRLQDAKEQFNKATLILKECEAEGWLERLIKSNVTGYERASF